MTGRVGGNDVELEGEIVEASKKLLNQMLTFL